MTCTWVHVLGYVYKHGCIQCNRGKNTDNYQSTLDMGTKGRMSEIFSKRDKDSVKEVSLKLS